MSEDQMKFLSLLGQPPARFTVEQVAWTLNFQVYEVQALITLRLLKPIGNARLNATKVFLAQDILEMAKNKAWLTKATNALYQYRLERNNLQKAHRSAAAKLGVVQMAFARNEGR